MARAALFSLLFAVVAVSPFPAPALAAVCKPERCGNLTVSYPFGVVWGAEENACAQLGFQVHCVGGAPYLGYYQLDFGLRILDIFYSNASLLVSDVHKLGDFNLSGGCHVPKANTASKIAAPFFLSDLNKNLIFYNCTKTPARAARERARLVGTACRNNTFVRAGGRYGESSGLDPGYGLPGCNAAAVPVLGAASRQVNAKDYAALITEGFLLTWQPPPAAAAGTSSGKPSN